MTSSETELCLTSLKIEDFLAALASGRPTPGGGSAAALAGATAGALVCMVAQLTIGREQYAACQQQMIHVRDDADTLRRRLIALVDEDARVYQDLMHGYTLPRVSDADNARRTSEIQRALRRASEVPLETAEACGQLIELAATGSALGNRNAASDAAVAALLAHAGLRCAALNVHTNLRSLRDESFKASAEARLGQLQGIGDAALAKALTAAGLGD
jgi:formiminotetrahydrofolate cyclodeaminase